MSTLNLDTAPNCVVEITVRESDPFTEKAYVSFDRHMFQTSSKGCDEMFLTPSQLDLLGRYLIRQAEEIRQAQEIRKK